MKIVSERQSCGIEAQSVLINDVHEFGNNIYDVLILTSSWDARCLNLTKIDFSNINNCILIMFEDRDKDGMRDNHDKVIYDWSSKCFGNVEKISGKSIDVDGIFGQLFKKITEICLQKRSPIRIFFDLSTCPRFISLSMLSKCFDYGISKSIDFFYGECFYPSRSIGVIGENEVVFTSGEWESKSVEHLNGKYQPGNRLRFIVSVGFEGNKTLRALNKEDPDDVLLLVPDPGFDDGYISRVMEANAELIKTEDIGEASIIRCHAGDAIGVWQKLDDLGDAKNYNQKFLCAGSKPHSLGMALAAMADKSSALIYSKPQRHSPIKIEPIEKYWLYSINSSTVPI